MSLTPQRRQYDFCRFRLYPVIQVCFYSMIQSIYNKQETQSTGWHSSVRSLQDDIDIRQQCLSQCYNTDKDFVKF